MNQPELSFVIPVFNELDSLGKRQMNQPELSFVIPAFNEQDRLGKTLTRLEDYLDHQGIRAEIIVVDDGSNDKTSDVAQSYGVKCVGYSCNMGISFAFRYGTNYAHGKYIVFFPADVDSMEIIGDLLAPLKKGFDCVQTSKRHPDSVVIGYSKARWTFSNNWNRAIRFMFAIPYTDTDYVRAFRREVVRKIVPNCKINGAAGEPELVIRTHRAGFKIAMIPCRIIHTEKGRVNIKFMIQSVLALTMLRLWLLKDISK